MNDYFDKEEGLENLFKNFKKYSTDYVGSGLFIDGNADFDFIRKSDELSVFEIVNDFEIENKKLLEEVGKNDFIDYAEDKLREQTKQTMGYEISKGVFNGEIFASIALLSYSTIDFLANSGEKEIKNYALIIGFAGLLGTIGIIGNIKLSSQKEEYNLMIKANNRMKNMIDVLKKTSSSL